MDKKAILSMVIFRFAILFVLFIVIINLALVDSKQCKKKRRRFVMIVSNNLYFESIFATGYIELEITITVFATSPRYMPAGDTFQYTCHLCDIAY